MDNTITAGAGSTVIYNIGLDSSELSEMTPEELMDAFIKKALSPDGPGAEATSNAVGNKFGQQLASALNDAIAERDDIPQSQKDKISDTINATLEANNLDTTDEAIALVDMIEDMMEEWAKEEIQEASDSTSAGGAGDEEGKTEGGKGAAGGAEGGSSAGGTGGAQNWMVALAKAMSKIASHHLEQMIHKQDILGQLQEQNKITEGEQTIAGGQFEEATANAIKMNNEGEVTGGGGTAAAGAEVTSNAKKLGAQARQMTEMTAEIQAHAQMFKMMQETMTTVIKSVGEALNGTVRKQ